MKWAKPNAFDQIIQVIQGTGGNPIVVSANGKLIPHNNAVTWHHIRNPAIIGAYFNNIILTL